MYEASYLKIGLASNPVLKLTEDGEHFAFDLSLVTRDYDIQVKDLQIKLVKLNADNLPTLLVDSYSSSNVNYINAFKAVGLACKIKPDKSDSRITTFINEFKSKVFDYAKSVELFSNSQKINEDEVRKNLIALKDLYVNSILGILPVRSGKYHLYVSIKFGFHTGPDTMENLSSKLQIEDYSSALKVDLDNFLGRIMSNILFSPDQFLIIYPEYKSSILQ